MQALRQVLLDFDQSALDGALKALHAGRTMTLDDDPLQTQKACAIMPRRRQIGLQTLEQRHGYRTGQACTEPALEQRLDT
ncbi:hypothetical protein D3C80_1758640 [compost metagenome]